MVSTAHTARMDSPGPPPITVDEMVPGGSFKGYGNPNTLNIPARLGQHYVDLDTRFIWVKATDDGAASGWEIGIGSSGNTGPVGLATGYAVATGKVVAFGDSLTSGTGATNSNFAYPQILDSEYLPASWTVENKGVSNNKVADLVARYAADVYPHRPVGGETVYVTLLIGINDIRQDNTSGEDLFDDVMALVATMRADGFKVLVSTLLHCFNATAAQVAEIENFNIRLRDSIDTDGVLDANNLISQNQHRYDKDGLHINDYGYNLLAYGWDQLLQRSVGSRYPLAANHPMVQFHDGFDPSGNKSNVYPSVHGSDFDTGFYWQSNEINVITNNVGRYSFTSFQFRPLTGNAYDLGSSGLTWRDLYMAGVANLDVVTPPSAPSAGRLKLYADSSGGKVRLMVRFPSGAAQVIFAEP